MKKHLTSVIVAAATFILVVSSASAATPKPDPLATTTPAATPSPPPLDLSILSWQSIMEDGVAKIKATYPDAYAGSTIEGSKATINFVGVPPKGAARLMGKLPVPLIIEGGAAASEKNATATTESAHMAVRASLPIGTLIYSDSDPVEGIVTVHVGTSAGDAEVSAQSRRSQDLPGVAQKAANDRVGEGASSIKAVVSYEPGAQGGASSSYGYNGGQYLRGGDGGYCTAGVVVKSRTNSELGILTAGHCSNTAYIQGRDRNLSLAFRAEVGGNYGDAQWSRSSSMMDAWFLADRTVGRPVKGKRVATVSREILEHFGQNSGHGYGTFKQSGACLLSWCNLVQTWGISNPGDSGGPWFSGNNIYGTNVGHSSAFYNINYAYYMPIDRSLSRFGLNLCVDRNGEPSC